MAGFGKSMKKRPFPDEDEQDEAVDAEVADVVAADSAVGADDPDNEAAERGDGGGTGQAAYEKFVKNGIRLIYSEPMLPTILKSLENNGNPLGGLVNTTLMVVKRLESGAAKAGVQIPEDAVEQGTLELMVDMAKFSQKSGGHEYTPEELQDAQEAVAYMRGEMAGGAQPGAQPGQQQSAAPARRGLGSAMQPQTA